MKRNEYIKSFNIISFILGALFSAVLIVALSNFVFGGKFISEKKYDRLNAIEDEFGKYYDMQKIITNQSYYETDLTGMDKSISSDILNIVDDRYSGYMTEEEYKTFEKKYLTSYSGVGVALKSDEDNKIYVNRILPGSPAERAELSVGDKILKINNETVKSLDDATRLINKKNDSTVFTIERGGEVKEFIIAKTSIEDNGVSYEVLDKKPKIAVVKVSTFRKGTSKALNSAFKDIESQGCENIIIDLRGNGGGVVEEAFKSADLLIGKADMGTIVYKKSKKIYTSKKSKFDFKINLAIDDDTASAAEIFASILKDQGIPAIGVKTFGKGVIQTVFKLHGGSVLKLTTAEYIMPDGSKLNGKGIKPDIVLDSKEDIVTKAEEQFSK